MARPTAAELLERRQRAGQMNALGQNSALMAKNDTARSALPDPDPNGVMRGPTYPTSASGGSGISAGEVGNAPVPAPPNTPQPSGADSEPLAGGNADNEKDLGTGIDVLAQKTSEQRLEDGKASAEAMENTRKNSNGQTSFQGKHLNEKLEGQGIPVRKSFQQMQDEIYKYLKRDVEDKKLSKKEAAKHRTGWRKIFNKISEDEMGLFLMDFGMRAMVAGETMGSAGAIGAAGSGAMGALQSKRRQGVEDDMAMQTTAHDMAVGQYGAESSRISADASMRSAKANETRANTAGQGYRGEKAWLYELMVTKRGMSEEEFFALISGDTSLSERRAKLFDYIRDMKAEADFILADENGKLFKDYTRSDMNTWVENAIKDERGGSALGGGGATTGSSSQTTQDYLNNAKT